MKNDAETQVNFDSEIIDDLRDTNKKLEKLHYNTRFNSGKSLHDEIQSVTERDELISLRNEFKNMILINQKLKKDLSSSSASNKPRDCCFCVII
jgi:hypothetical protein